MSQFQGKVNIELTPYVQGQITRSNPCAKEGYFAEDANCFAGGFVFAGTNVETQVKGFSAGATEVVGIAKRTPYQANFTGADSNIYNLGSELTVLINGYVAVKPSNESVKGHDVVVDPATGEIQTLVLTGSTTVTGTTDTTTSAVDTPLDNGVATFAYTNMPAGFIATGWKVNVGAGADSLCEIYKL